LSKLVCVQGLGFVGATMAIAIALADSQNGSPFYEVVGVDLPTTSGRHRVKSINQGKFPFETSDPKIQLALDKISLRGNLSATTNPNVYERAEIIIVDIHFDIAYHENEPKLDFLLFKKSIETIASRMQPDALLLIESTVPPGTCENIIAPLVSKIFVERGFSSSRLLLAHSYERVMPGKNYLDSIINYWRVYSGYSEIAADMCEEFLSKVINIEEYPLTRLSSPTASETAKVLENTYRAVNIAFIAEWTEFAETIGIDLFEIIEAIKKRPSHENIRYPGLGVGGYCLTKDPTFGAAASRDLFNIQIDFPFSRLAVKQISQMPFHAIRKLKDAFQGKLAGKKILICGLSYRQDVADTRFSPSEILYRGLISEKSEVDVHDPFVKWWSELEISIPIELPNFDYYDAIIFAVPHDLYKHLNLLKYKDNLKSVYVLDAFMVFNIEQRKIFKSQGINIHAIGVGE